MRAIQFAKIDFIKTKQQILWILLVIPVVLLFMLRQSSDSPMPLVIFFCYTLFMALIFSTIPFGSCQRQETGFLLLLPATTRDRISGRFLYGLSYMMVAALVGCVGMYFDKMISGAVIEAEIPFCMIAFAVSMVFMALEYVILYLFGEQQSPNILSLIRMIPGFVFFFGSIGLIEGAQDDPEMTAALMEYIGGHLMLIGWCSLAAAFVLFAAAAMLCTAVTKKRDFG
ncbi:MAG: ABC-2 transporter permease [Lachnospiraceae bacterium]|nr:ABC-2 transporter permease [Lachnospiraceae bacterium]